MLSLVPALKLFLPQVFWGCLGVFLLSSTPAVPFIPSLGCLAEFTELGALRTGGQSPQFWARVSLLVGVSVLKHNECCASVFTFIVTLDYQKSSSWGTLDNRG